MSVQRISKRAVDAAKPQQATYLIRDSELKGFVLVVTPYGGKSYAVDYRAGRGRRGRKRRMTIGKHGSPWTPETARREAFRLLLWARYDRPVPTRGFICRSHSERGEAKRPSSPSANEIRINGQPQDRESTKT